MRGTADMLVGLSRAAWHRNDLVASAELPTSLRRPRGGRRAPAEPVPVARRDGPTTGSRARLAAALDLLDDAQRVYVGDFSPPVHPVHASRARLLAASGDLVGAPAWAREHGMRADDELCYLPSTSTSPSPGSCSPKTGHTGTGSPQSPGRRVGRGGDLRRSSRRRASWAGCWPPPPRRPSGTVIEIEVLRARVYRADGERGAALERAQARGRARRTRGLAPSVRRRRPRGSRASFRLFAEQRPASRLLRSC